MTIIDLPTQALQGAGLSRSEIDDWALSAPREMDAFSPAAQAVSEFLTRGSALQERLPLPSRRSEVEQAAAEGLAAALTAARVAFLDAHADQLYDELTDRRCKPIRVEWLVNDAGTMVPGLVPGHAEMEAERALPLADKRGLELAQGLLIEHVLALPDAGRHLVESMLAPTPEALERLDEFRSRGQVDLGRARVTRQGRAAVLEICNQRHLNAEDGSTLGPTEAAVDLILLDPESEVGVLRGAVVDHPKYAGERIFGAGINLTYLYQGRIDFLFYLVRDLGYVNKLYRGLMTPAGGVEKLWVAAVERYAIGGACQLLHVVDHVIATRGLAALSAGAQGGDHPRRLQPAAPAGRRRPRRAPGDHLRSRVASGRPRRRAAGRRGGRARRDGSGDRVAGRPADQLRTDQRGGQPPRAAHRTGAA